MRNVSAIHFSSRNLVRNIGNIKAFSKIVFRSRIGEESDVHDFYFIGCFLSSFPTVS